MTEKVTHLRRHGKDKKRKKIDRLTKAERRAQLLQQREQWLERWIAFAQAFIEELLNAEVQELLGRPAHTWGDRAEHVDVNARCNRCGRQQRGWFRRNGRYPRSLVLEGLIVDFGVPRVRCACGGTVDLSFSVFVPYARVSEEVAERVREAIALGLTLRQSGAMIAPANGGPLAKSTLNARVLEVHRLAEGFHTKALDRVPPVVLLDGVWVKVLEPTGERFVDKTGRERPRMQRKKIGLLIAYGVDPTTGEWWVLDWERAAQEDQASWARLLERLRQRGVSAARGLRLIVSDGSEGLAAALDLVDLGPGVRHQRCVFHKLRNVAKAVKAALAESKDEKRKQRRAVVQEAAAIYAGEDRGEILQRRDAFVAKWQAREPEAVATLLRDFEQTIVYVDVMAEAAERGEQWERRHVRTTSALERLNRRLRQMVRQVVLFHAEEGLEVRVYLILLQAGEILMTRGDHWLEVLENELAAA
jgi:transposase-like protein